MWLYVFVLAVAFLVTVGMTKVAAADEGRPTGPPTLERLGELQRWRADEWVEAEHREIPPTWFLADGWDTLPPDPEPPLTWIPRVLAPIVPTGPIEGAIAAAFPEDPSTAIRVARCESGLRPAVISRTNDYGLFQINKKVHEHHLVASMGYVMDDMLEVGPNLAVARSLYNGSGWGAWYMSKHCWN